MMKLLKPILAAFAALAAMATLSLAHAQSAVVDQARAQKIIGEMYTGYVGVADEARATPEIRRNVTEVNSKRLALYQKLSKEQGVTPDQVAALTAEKLIGRAAAGEMIKPGASQPWTPK
jgi:uncharacterized protein YdbL (DUF1318 family)